jgi:hypothetical protein
MTMEAKNEAKFLIDAFQKTVDGMSERQNRRWL